MKKIITEFIIMFTIIAILFKINIQIKKDIYDTTIYFIRNVLPSLYPIMIISIYLKNNVLAYTNSKIIYFLISLITYAPSNALLTNDKKLITYSCIINPFYSYSIIANIYNNIIAIKITIINILINNLFIIARIVKNKQIVIKNNSNNINIIKTVKISAENIINVYGITLFFTIINNVLLFLKVPKSLIIFIDIINGFKLINQIKNFKLPLIILLNSFTGISILFQIKSINDNFKYRLIIYKFIISLISLMLTIPVIYL